MKLGLLTNIHINKNFKNFETYHQESLKNVVIKIQNHYMQISYQMILEDKGDVLSAFMYTHI